MRPIQWHLKNNWRVPVSGKDYSNPQVSSSPLTLVVRRRKCFQRPTITPNKICSANLYRRIKRRVECSLRRAHRQRVLVSARKPHAHKLPRAKGSFSSLEAVSRPLCRQDCSSSNRQHYSSVLHKQRRGYEVRPSLCSTLENYNLVHQEASDPQGTAHPRQAERSSRQVIQAGPDHSNRMIPSPRGFPSDLQQMAPTTDRPVCYEVQQQVASLCVSNTGSPGRGIGCTQSTMGGYGRIRLPSDSHPGQGSRETMGHPLHEVHSHCPGMAQHALVLGPSGHVQPDPIESAQPVNTALQSDPSQKSENLNLHAWLLEPQQSRNRVSLRQWQQELKLLRGFQPDQSMRQSGPFLQSGASLMRWTSGHPL